MGDFLTDEKVQPGKGGAGGGGHANIVKIQSRGLVYWWDRTDYVQMPLQKKESGITILRNVGMYVLDCMCVCGGGGALMRR